MDKSRTRDLATLLPWLGMFLFTPPVLYLFRPTLTIYGVPLLPLYLFAIWFLLIFASRQLTRYLVNEADQPTATPKGQPGQKIRSTPDTGEA